MNIILCFSETSSTLRILMGPEFDNNFSMQIIDRIGSLRSFYLLNAIEPNRTPQDLLAALLFAVGLYLISSTFVFFPIITCLTE